MNMWMTLPWEAYLTLVVAGGLLLGMAFRVAQTDLLALSALGVVMLVQNVTGTPRLPDVSEAIAGFGNAGVITIGLLFAVVAGLEFTGGTSLATGWLLSRARTLIGAQIRMLIPVAGLSGFLNNTPVVAALLPVVTDLSKRLSISPSRLLLPLSYAAILGGMCTMLGTSTNLIIRDLYFDHTGESLGFFAPARVGIPATALGIVYIIVFTRWMLPERKPAVSISDDPQKYTVEMQVDPDGGLVGRTIEDAGLRHLPGLYIAEIQRGDGIITAAKPSERLQADDVLILVGALDSVVDLRKIRGLLTPDDQTRKLRVPAWRRTLVEAVVSPRCGMLGKTIRQGRFRSHYNAAVVAVARGGKRYEGKLGDFRLEAGDVLLLEASPSFLHRQRSTRDFFLVSTVDRAEVRRHERAPLAIGIMLAMVIAASATSVSILTASLIAALLMIAFRCCTSNEARRSVDWSVLIVIGAAIGLGAAMEKSTAADAIAGGLLSIAAGDPFWTLVAIYAATVICTELITNNAAAALMFSPAISSAAGLGIDPMPFVIAVMIAASASFLTPFGYQTNMMVYSVGGYRMRDYLCFGLPLNLLVFAVAMYIIPAAWPLM